VTVTLSISGGLVQGSQRAMSFPAFPRNARKTQTFLVFPQKFLVFPSHITTHVNNPINPILSVEVNRQLREKTIIKKSDYVIKVNLRINLEEKYFASVVMETNGN